MARTKKTAAPAQEPEATTTPAQEAQQEPQEAPAVPEVQEPAPEPEAPQEPPQVPEDGPDTPPADQEPLADPAPEKDPEPDPVPAGEMPLPYKATVNVALAVVRKAVGLGTADQLKPVGTLKQGAAVTVIHRKDGYAQLVNGLWIDEAFLAVASSE